MYLSVFIKFESDILIKVDILDFNYIDQKLFGLINRIYHRYTIGKENFDILNSLIKMDQPNGIIIGHCFRIM